MTHLAPGPLGLPVVGNLLSLRGHHRIAALARDFERYGDVVHYRLGRLHATVLRHPDHIRHVLQENASNYQKGRGQRRARVILGNGLITNEGASWKAQRRLMQPAFHAKRLAPLVDVMARVTERRIASWASRIERRERFDLAEEMLALTLVIVGETLFGADMERHAPLFAEAVPRVLGYATTSRLPLASPPLWVPTPENRAVRAAVDAIDRIVSDIVAARRRDSEPRHDLLGLLMAARDEETGAGMSERQLRDEVVTILGAGHETVANALAWTFYLLGKDGLWARRVGDEARRVIGAPDSPSRGVPKVELLAELKDTRRVIEESMRLYPPVWMFGRTALEDDTVGGYHVPKGSVVGISPYFAHRHPAYWKDPEGFDPDRFEGGAPLPNRFVYIPFGGGPRICIGNTYAMMEAQVVVAMVAARYAIELLPGPPAVPEPGFTLRPGGGVPARLVPL